MPLTKPDLFITDVGEDIELVDREGETFYVGRYAVWERRHANSKAEVIATSGDLEHLKQTFGDLPVHRIEEKKTP